MQREDPQGIYALLTGLGIPFAHCAHPAAMSMDDLAQPSAELGAPFCKNLFLANRQQTDFYLLLIRGDKRFRTAEVSRKLEVSRLSFGDEGQLYELLGVRPGAITPMGLVFDAAHRVRVIIDRDLLALGQMCVHPCVNTESLCLPVSALLDVFLPHTGHVPTFLDITGE